MPPMVSSYKDRALADQADGDDPTRQHFKAEDVIADRSGDVLIKQTVLKADHFPSMQRGYLLSNISLLQCPDNSDN